MRAYLSLLSNPRKSLSEEIDETRSLLGEPLTVAANALRASGVIASDVHVFVTIDQFETLLRQSQDDRDDQKHRRFVNLVFDLLASRNPAVSYRVGTRPNAVMKLSDAARDYAEVDLDEILQRTESGRKKFWPFQRVAHDAFRRRIAAIETPYRDTIVSSANAIRDVFGASPSNHDRGNDCASRKPERVVKLEDTWDEAVCEVLESMALEDPVSAKLAEAWIRQRTARGEDLSAGNWATAEHRPWETHQKRWWKKERLPQASLQVASSNAQRLVYYGEEDILSLSGENILAFICICRSIWECDARFRTEHSGDNDTTQFPFEPKQQAQGIWEASEFWHRKIPQSADGDTLQRLVDVIGQRLNQQLISDRAMSYPGANGFSLAVDDLCGDPEIKRLLDDATAECLLLQRAHTPKTKSRGRSIKWYPHPILAPFYGLTVPRTKEPLYVSVATLRQWLVTGSVLAADESASNKHESEAKSSKLNPKDDQGTESAPRPSEHSTSDRQKTFRFSEDHDD
ncbi:MAG: hypothetical protein R3C59_03925 [Planctomycetaceae bacterium]